LDDLWINRTPDLSAKPDSFLAIEAILFDNEIAGKREWGARLRMTRDGLREASDFRRRLAPPTTLVMIDLDGGGREWRARSVHPRGRPCTLAAA
jgi:hypothetical protein